MKATGGSWDGAHWPIYFLGMMLISALLAATLIDAEFFIIPLTIPWFVVPFALAEHAIWDRTGWPGALNLSNLPAALTAGDLAFLKALYYRNTGLGPSLSRVAIHDNMAQQFALR